MSLERYELEQIVSDYSYQSDYSTELQVIDEKLTLLALMVLRTSGYTNVFKKNPLDNRKHMGKNVKELADAFGIEFRK
tara:strand:- start:150 stop:383 length:234 start_codon:yes stop_codon:yes gene_type:complete